MKDEYSVDYSIPENEVSFLKGMIREYYQPEIERLNNIINELEEYMIGKDIYKILLYKLRDLKESEKE